ncbi:MAG TPA: hypothetical protein VG144_00405 [Gaiellaceae bacterium]|jgi:hypothetical protein|nr:hypothetical protein [Gaiellaceae bacterium]
MAALRVVTGALAATAALFVVAPATAAVATPTPSSPAADASVQALPAFAWNGVPGAAKYEFALAADAGFNSPALGMGEGQFFTRNTRATVKKTLPNGTYWWRVRAVTSEGEVSPWSTPRPLRKVWSTAPTLLSPTQGAVATHPTTPLVLKWAPVPHATKYLVTIASDPALGSAVLAQGNVETRGTSYAPRAMLLPPGTYYWGVTPLDAQGHRGASSQVASFTWTWPTSSATTVGDLRADAEVYDPFFSWDPVPGAARYELEVNPSQDFAPGSKVCCTDPVIAPNHAPTRLLRDNTYYWRVRSLDAFGNAGEWNVGPSFTKTFDKVPPVTAPSVKNVRMRDHLSDPGSDVDGATPGYQTNVPVVTWDPVPGASSYEVDVFPFEGICNWSSSGVDHWHSTTATNAWTPLGYGWNNVKPYADARQVATETPRPESGDSYCVRVRARSDRDSGTQEVYGDYTYMNGGTGPAFQWVGPSTGSPCTPSCQLGYLGATDYLVPATGVTSARMPLFTWKPLPRYAKKTLLNTSGAAALTMTSRTLGPIDLRVTVQDNSGDSSKDDLVLLGANPETYTHNDGDVNSLAAAINGDADGPVNTEVHVSGVRLAAVSDTPFSPGAQSYFVLVAKDPSFSNIVDYAFTQMPAYAPRGTTSITSYPDETTLYYWAVLPAAGLNGNGAVGDPLIAAPSNLRKESIPPTLTTPTAGESVTGQPTFRWSPAEGARRYRLQVSQDPAFGPLLDDVSTAATAYTANKAYPADTVLYWRVRADDENLIGLRWSAVGSFQRRLPAPTPRFDAASGEMFPVMAWAAVPGAVSYRIAVDEPDGEHFEYDDFRSASATFVRMTGTGVTGIRVRANFATNSTQTTPGPWSSTVFHTRTVGEPTGARTDATADHVLFGWDPKPGTKQYRLLVSSREDFSAVVEDVKTDNAGYAPVLTQPAYMQGGTFWWKVAAMDEDLNLGDYTRAHSFSLAKGPDAVRVTQKLRLRAKGRLKRRKTRRLVVTVTAGARPLAGARVRLFGVGLKTKWKASGRGGRVVFRVRPKARGFVFLYATKRGYLPGNSRVRVR